MKAINPLIWMNREQTEEAAQFYVSIFPNSRIMNVSRYGDMGPGPKGSVMMVTFTLNGEDYMMLDNVGPGETPFATAQGF